MKNCIILFSNADTPEKESLLLKTLLSLKKLNLVIILATHSTITEKCQNECDYIVYDKNNLIFNETDFFNYELPLTEANFNTQYFFGGISTRCYLHKKTYAPAVINLYIASFNLAESLGYDYALLWEYDFELNIKTSDFISKTFTDIKNQQNDGFFIPCQISGINSIHAVPSIFPIKKFNHFLPKKLLSEPINYINEIKLMICEEWIYHFFSSLENPKTMTYEEYENLVDLNLSNQVSSKTTNPLFWGLNSGIFIEKTNKSNWIFSIYNDSNKIINYDIKLFFDGLQIFGFQEQSICQKYWAYNPIDSKIIENVLGGENSIRVVETIIYDSTKQVYDYEINKYNLESISKSKVFFYY